MEKFPLESLFTMVYMLVIRITKNSAHYMTHSQNDYLQGGLSHIWLPYTQMGDMPALLPVRTARGSRIITEDGRELIDGIASWWSMCHGYQHPHIVTAVQEQAERLCHVMFAGLAHEQAYKLASRLTSITPDGLSRVFFSDSGSTAVEVAMKMAVQYHTNKGNSRKSKFISFENGYHGDTVATMAVSDPQRGMHKAYHSHIPKQYVMGIPRDEYSLAEFEEMLDGIAHTAAGMIIEPLVQCAGGMKFHSADILAELRRLARKYEMLFIADEVATGFCRTGFFFACEEAGITPDIMCIGKALTGGALPMAATIATEKVFDAFLGDSREIALMHGPTYMANPLACAAANASLDIFLAENGVEAAGATTLAMVEAMEDQLRAELAACKAMPGVSDVRVKGAIGVVEMDTISWSDIKKMRARAVEMGLWLRPFGEVIYLMPPLNISTQDLTALTTGMLELCRQV